MKKIIFSSMFLLLTATLFAQPEGNHDGPPKPPSVTDRWKHDSIKLQLYVTLSSSQISNTKNAFMNFYKDMDELMEKNKPLQQQPPTPPSREEAKKIHDARNNALKAIFNAAQWDRFEVFEREFMPPHPLRNDEHKAPTT